ncbi:Charged multivesicular body protein 6 [Geodia barretti]|uniref:Charged multivesicular body protein 6 n=1 Tax=Geodia barretti TaxID=519541 RepID=A0AA35S8N7_GEOBA|nr:Charged multivesicular body protein 6 [Geodia barretti]
MGSWLAALRGGRRRNDEPPQQSGPSRITEQDKAVLNLKKSRDKLQQYQKKISEQLKKERDIAKQLLRDGKKEKAKLLLKKKRFLEGLLANTDTQLENLQQMVDTIEFTQIEVKVVEGLKLGNEALNQLHKIMSLEDVEKIMGDTQEAVEYQREIDELLGQNLTARTKMPSQQSWRVLFQLSYLVCLVNLSIRSVPRTCPKSLPRTQESEHRKRQRRDKLFLHRLYYY